VSAVSTSRPESQVRLRPQLEALEDRAAPSGLGADFAVLGDYAVLALSGSKVDITNPQTQINGNVGLGQDATQNFSDGRINGQLRVDPTANNSKSNNVQVACGTVKRDLSCADQAAADASCEIASLCPTQNVSNITGSTTVCSTRTVNVLDVNNVQLDGSSTLTLKGGQNDYFLINVSGKFAMTGTSSINLSGVRTSHVLFNFVGRGQQVAFTGKSRAQGSFLLRSRDCSVSGATVNGAIIGASCQQIAITSGAQVCGESFCPPCDSDLPSCQAGSGS
jgi:hypothetical protein